MRNQFGWDYPPGVTGMEPEIAGYPPCKRCGHDADEHWQKVNVPFEDGENIDDGPCQWQLGDGNQPLAYCSCQGYEQYPPEPDPDEKYDRVREDRLG